MRNISKNWLRRTCFIPILLSHGAMAQASLPDVSINDLVKRTLIEKASVSPDGQFVAFLTARGVPTLDCYQVETRLVSLAPLGRPILLAGSCIRPEEVFQADSGALLPSAGSLLWAPAGTQLFFTRRIRNRCEALSLDPYTGRRRILQTKGWIDLQNDGDDLRIIGHHTAPLQKLSDLTPRDVSVRVGDEAQFVKPFEYPSSSAQLRIDEWILSSRSKAPEPLRDRPSNTISVPRQSTTTKGSYASTDEEVHVGDTITSPAKNQTAVLEWIDRNLQTPSQSYRTSRIVLDPHHRVLAPETEPACFYSLIGWGANRHFFYIRKDRYGSSIMKVDGANTTKIIFSDQASLTLLAGPQKGHHGDEFALFVRSTNLMPDELVSINLKSGKMRRLYTPNSHFRKRSLPTVRLISIPQSPIYGRLYLPSHASPNQRLPLVFTGYVSGPGFEASVGDELPVLALASHGIAVFAMNEYGVNVVSNSGNFDFELSRLARPLEAMQFVRSLLAADGTIDPNRCGISGVSYGSEIAMYAYWKAKTFKAVSVATASWGPLEALLVGIEYGEFLKHRGFPSIEHPEDARWKDLSASFNAREDLPPLLLQSPSYEEYFGNVEMWMQLHRVHAPVTWYSYPDEGHLKRSPANKWWVYERNLEWFCRWLLPLDQSSRRMESPRGTTHE